MQPLTDYILDVGPLVPKRGLLGAVRGCEHTACTPPAEKQLEINLSHCDSVDLHAQ